MRSAAAIRGKVALPAVLAAMTVAGTLAGCSSTTTGTPNSPSSSAGSTPSGLKDPLYNPCQQLSDDALRGTRLNPTSKQVSVDSGQDVDAFTKSCIWNSTEGPYGVGVQSLRTTIDQVRQNPKYTDFRDVQVGPRKGLVHLDNTAANGSKLDCYVSLPFAQGTIEVIMYWDYGQEAKAPQLPPCDLAISHAKDLEPYLPK
ncbi:DUF3558 domain-containing protein [Nocardia sp. NPDC051570]|uniref:DUF3558 domain-containing protein n=1 Tax=Nocardia sp. NPDC051570 TaxID=3364324 RepID=UPI0037AC2E1A